MYVIDEYLERLDAARISRYFPRTVENAWKDGYCTKVPPPELESWHMKMFSQDYPYAKGKLSQINYNIDNAGEGIIRDWHFDQPNKSFQIIVYIGEYYDGTVFEWKENGKVNKMDFQHNRAIMFDPLVCEHRYYRTPFEGKTINLVFK